MISVLITVPESERELLLADLMDAGTVGCIEEPAGVRAFFSGRDALANLPSTYLVSELREELTAASPEQVDDVDPILIGRRFCVVPRGSSHPTPEGRLRLEVDAGAAFGTGRHESTQLMLEAMESLIEPGMTVVDIGCGSGILSLAALLLGVGRVLGCDIDPVFLSSIPLELRSRVFVGSADGLRSECADLVLANISAKVIDWIAFDLSRIAKKEGTLLLSGFLADRTPTQHSPFRVSRNGDWVCWSCRPREFAPHSAPTGGTVHPLDWY